MDTSGDGGSLLPLGREGNAALDFVFRDLARPSYSHEDLMKREIVVVEELSVFLNGMVPVLQWEVWVKNLFMIMYVTMILMVL